jgi:hypothetical protein
MAIAEIEVRFQAHRACFRRLLKAPACSDPHVNGPGASDWSMYPVCIQRTHAAANVPSHKGQGRLNELRESLQQQTATADVLKVISRSTFEAINCVLDGIVVVTAFLFQPWRVSGPGVEHPGGTADGAESPKSAFSRLSRLGVYLRNEMG